MTYQFVSLRAKHESCFTLLYLCIFISISRILLSQGRRELAIAGFIKFASHCIEELTRS